jgi:transposase
MVAERGMSASRRMRTVEEKRRIVEETLVRGTSVAAIARKYDVNANLLFGWRRLHQQGLLEMSREPAAKLLPVEVTTPTVVATRSMTVERSKSRTARVPKVPSNYLEIDWPDGVRVRLQGSVDAVVLGTVLSALTQQNQ